MKIGSDISIFASNQLSRTQSAIARSLQRLSTGLRVNSPQDDMAAFSESVNLSSEIRGYTQSIRNINDSVGVLNTASSALSTQLEIIQKMRELAVQASNGTLSSNDRANINTQVQALYQEFQRITSTTQFNGINLLDGSFSSVNIQLGANAGDTASISSPNMQGNSVFQKTIGTGTYHAAQTISDINDQSLVTGDINGDGIADLVVLHSTYVEVALGKGDGTFSSSTTFANDTANVSGFEGITLADTNGDGIKDIVTANWLKGTISVFAGNGDGTFKPRTTLALTNAEGVTTGDFNGDGKTDIFAVSDNGASIFFGNGDGTFKTGQTIWNSPVGFAVAPQIGDINGDGIKDAAVLDLNGNVTLLLGNGDGSFKAPSTLAPYTYGTDLQLADFNGDGKLDIVMSSGFIGGTAVKLMLGNGDGTFKAANVIYTGGGGRELQVADVNGDGVKDLLIADSGVVATLVGNGDGTFKTSATTSTSNATSLAVADFNRDGVPDLITGWTNLTSFLGNSQLVSAVSNISVSTQSSAQSLIGILDTAISTLKADQASIGASLIRFTESNNYNQLMLQNLSDAQSQATNVDIAAETSNLVRNQILEQAQVAVVGQANINSQLVLSLLKNL